MYGIHLNHSESGGQGKSWFMRVLVEYAQVYDYPFVLIDADPSKPDVLEFYPETGQQLLFSAAEPHLHDVDRIFELALESHVIINLPANIDSLIGDWFERNDILTLGPQLGIQVINWFVSGGGIDSVRLFKQTVAKYAGMRHVLVRNLALCDADDWSHILSPPALLQQWLASAGEATATNAKLQALRTGATDTAAPPADRQDQARRDLDTLILQARIPVIDLPKLSFPERDFIIYEGLSLLEACDYRCRLEERFSPTRKRGLTILGQQRVYRFLKLAFAAINSTGIWQSLQADPTDTAAAS